MRRITLFATLLALLMTVAAPASAGEPAFPDVISLPDGFFPEGIATGVGSTAYVGSLTDGAIWKGDLRSGEGEVFIEGVEGRLAVGMAYDRRTGYLFVAGGPDGNAYVYNGESGALVATLDLVDSGFVNDVIITKRAAYFTDSFAPQLYAAPLDRRGRVLGTSHTIPLGSDFEFVPGAFNANGIEATPDGRTLVVTNSTVGTLYTVDPRSGVAAEIDLGGELVNGDGLVLVGRTLYAVEGGKNQITEIKLLPDLTRGRIVDALVSDAFDVPTTAALLGDSLFAVNAKFNTPPLPSTPYEIVRVSR